MNWCSKFPSPKLKRFRLWSSSKWKTYTRDLSHSWLKSGLAKTGGIWTSSSAHAGSLRSAVAVTGCAQFSKHGARAAGTLDRQTKTRLQLCLQTAIMNQNFPGDG